MAITPSVWDSLNKGAAVTLSGSNLVATVSSGTGSVAATNRIGGLTYFELLIGATLSGSARVGVCNLAFVKTGLLGVDNNGVGYDSGGTVKINNATVATIAAYAATNNIGVAINPMLNLIWFRVNGGNWNNDVIGNQNPVGAVGGISIAALVGNYLPAWGGSATSSNTAKFATASWTYAAPTGFVSPDTFGAIPVNGVVASRAASFSQYGRANGLGYGSAGSQVSSIGASRLAALAGAWYGGYRVYGPAQAAKYVSGQTREAGVAVAGKRVFAFDRTNGFLLGTVLSDGSGNFSMDALGRTSVLIVGIDSPYDSVTHDAIVPV